MYRHDLQSLSLAQPPGSWHQRGHSGRISQAAKCVVCTSSLDLGVDFAPVERVFQISSPKTVGRLLQRAGRSGHRPDAESRVTCVPAHAFELIEIAAVKEAIKAGVIEARCQRSLTGKRRGCYAARPKRTQKEGEDDPSVTGSGSTH